MAKRGGGAPSLSGSFGGKSNSRSATVHTSARPDMAATCSAFRSVPGSRQPAAWPGSLAAAARKAPSSPAAAADSIAPAAARADSLSVCAMLASRDVRYVVEREPAELARVRVRRRRRGSGWWERMRSVLP